jgi:dephospho-CoA kinase
MENQWEDQKKVPLANYVIENIDLTSTKNQVQKIHKTLLSTCVSYI